MVKENIIDIEYSETMEKSYIDYAMSVITARAIPDIRDGLKPVQRRILYDMDELKVNSDKPHRKSARIVGDTMGKYHPHGDSSLYESEVVMARDFKYGTPLIDGQGNFGSIEGDGAAAQRYTECRLTKYAEKVLLDDLKCNTVDFVSNYDGSEKEPLVLPSKLPNILVNGTDGIAVGMATKIPPHNICNVIDATIEYINNPKIETNKLVNILVGPDFPTGGYVVNKSELADIYESGKGRIKIRGKIEIEELEKGKKNLVITEIPYEMIGEGIRKFLLNVAELVENQTIDGITDISNQTSKEGVRIVIELKKGADVEYIKNVLYKKTKLEDTFGYSALLINNGIPCVMGLKDILESFMNFQYEIYTRKYSFLLNNYLKKKETLEGLIKATDVISEIIEVIRYSPNIKAAKECLITGNTEDVKFKTASYEKVVKTFSFTETQADSIISMRLSQLNGLEIDKLQKEYKEFVKKIIFCERILGSRTVMKNEIKKVLISLKEEFGVPRKTNIIDAEVVVIKEREIKEKDITVLIDKFGYIHVTDTAICDKNKEYVEENYKYIINTTNKRKLLVFTDRGKMHTLRPNEIPYAKLKDKGQPLDNVSGYDSREENIVFVTELPPMENTNELIFLSTDGLIKRVNINEFDVTRKTTDSTKLNKGASLYGVFKYTNGQMIIGTKNGYYTRFNMDLIPVKKKNAVGAIALRIDDDFVKYAADVNVPSEEISIDGIIVPASRIKQLNRGAKGTKIRL